MSEGGTYVLLFERDASGTVAVGALGDVELPAGGYAYVGSALGPGGFDRIDRHRRVAAGEHDVRHWHVDYLGAAPATRLVDAPVAPSVDAECAVAGRLREAGFGEPVAGFGASDCGCRSHLFGPAGATELRTAVREAYDAVEG
jgi:endonuclease-3